MKSAAKQTDIGAQTVLGEVWPNDLAGARALFAEKQVRKLALEHKRDREAVPHLSAFDDTEYSHLVSQIGGLGQLIERLEQQERLGAAVRRQPDPPAEIAEPAVYVDDFAGLTAHACAHACNVDRCVITEAPFCGHPHKNALQATFMNKPAIVARFRRAREFVDVLVARELASAKAKART